MEKNYRLLKNRNNIPVLDYLLINRQEIKEDIDKTFDDINFNHKFHNEEEVLDLLINVIHDKNIDTIGLITDCKNSSRLLSKDSGVLSFQLLELLKAQLTTAQPAKANANVAKAEKTN